MKNSPRSAKSPRLHPAYAQGFSLIELMVAVVIGLFITLGLSQMFISMMNTSKTDQNMAQFQDDLRTVSVILTNGIQNAGYISNPTTSTAATVFTSTTANPDTSTFYAGTGIVGTTGTTNDTINTAFQTGGSSADGLTNCQGGVATGANSPQVFVNNFYISNNQLVCKVNGGSTVVVLSGSLYVSSMKIKYGVANPAATTNSVASYLDGSSVTSAVAGGKAWSYVSSAQITLTLGNPVFMDPETKVWSPPALNSSGNVTNPYITWVQTINVSQ